MSKEKGNIIVKDILQNSIVIENITLKSSLIEFDLPERSVILKKINEDIKNSSNKDLLKYLNFRKQRISSKTAYVYVPETKKELMQNVKDIINCYNKILKYGMYLDDNNILHSKLSYNNTIKLSKKLYNILRSTSIVLKG